jgi:hypothetical protein
LQELVLPADRGAVKAGSVLDLQPMISVLFITDAAKMPPNANGKGQSDLCYL